MTGLPDPKFWRDRRVLVTGHTGFKGAWLSLWLRMLGAEVCGFALAPATEPNLFTLAGVAKSVDHRLGDIRDLAALHAVLAGFRPQVVFHLAAQSLVRASYRDPVETYATNVMGTVNVLEAVRQTESVRAVVIVTSDKCYENHGGSRAYRESRRWAATIPTAVQQGRRRTGGRGVPPVVLRRWRRGRPWRRSAPAT